MSFAMRFYQLLTLLVLSILPFFSVQIDVRINYVIYGFAFLLLLYPEPIRLSSRPKPAEGPFVKNLTEDFKKKNIITIFFLLFLAASTLSTIFSIDQTRSLLTLMVYFSYFIIFTSIRSIFPTQKSKELLVAYFLSLVTVLSFISLYNTLIRHYVNRESEGVSFMWAYYGHNHLSALLLFAIPLAFYFLKVNWSNQKLRFLLLVTFSFLFLTFFFTLARASMLSLFVATVLSLLLSPKNLVKRSFTIIFLGITFSAVIFLFTLIVQKPKIPIAIGHNRLVYWNQVLINVKNHPAFGTGLDTFGIQNAAYFYGKRLHTLRADYAHNFFLQMLSDSGIFGFLTSIGLVVSVFWQWFKQIGDWKLEIGNSQRALFLTLWVGLLASTLNSMVDFDWQLPTVFFIFWLLAGSLNYHRSKRL